MADILEKNYYVWEKREDSETGCGERSDGIGEESWSPEVGIAVV